MQYRFFADGDCENDCASTCVAGLRYYTIDFTPEPGVERHYHRVLEVLWLDDSTGEPRTFHEEQCHKRLEPEMLPMPRMIISMGDLYGLEHL